MLTKDVSVGSKTSYCTWWQSPHGEDLFLRPTFFWFFWLFWCTLSSFWSFSLSYCLIAHQEYLLKVKHYQHLVGKVKEKLKHTVKDGSLSGTLSSVGVIVVVMCLRLDYKNWLESFENSYSFLWFSCPRKMTDGFGTYFWKIPFYSFFFHSPVFTFLSIYVSSATMSTVAQWACLISQPLLTTVVDMWP